MGMEQSMDMHNNRRLSDGFSIAVAPLLQSCACCGRYTYLEYSGVRMPNYLTIASIIFGFLSAGAWLRASLVKVSRETEVQRRTKKARRRGSEPSLAGISLDGWDMSGTFRAQSAWNSIGAVLAATSISCQAISQLLQNL